MTYGIYGIGDPHEFDWQDDGPTCSQCHPNPN